MTLKKICCFSSSGFVADPILQKKKEALFQASLQPVFPHIPLQESPSLAAKQGICLRSQFLSFLSEVEFTPNFTSFAVQQLELFRAVLTIPLAVGHSDAMGSEAKMTKASAFSKTFILIGLAR